MYFMFFYYSHRMWGAALWAAALGMCHVAV